MSALKLLPWQDTPLHLALQQLTSPAVVMHGQEGGGQLALALNVAKAWLCEAHGEGASTLQPACGRCGSCHLVDSGYHPDLKVVVPEVLQPTLGWSHAEDEGSDKADGKKTRKPSQEIKVDAIREVVTFSQHTVSRGRAKVVVVHPADRMNTVAANTLLKTLEEPPGRVRFLLSCGGLDDLLPTVRSRCQAWQLPAPHADGVLDWLCTNQPSLKADDARALLAAAGGSPEGALGLIELGWTAEAWRRFPRDVQAGQVAGWAAWPLPRFVDALQKLCHDLVCVTVGGAPRFFDVGALTIGQPDLARLTAWGAELRQVQRQADHPWNAPLKIEALVFQARKAVASAPSTLR